MNIKKQILSFFIIILISINNYCLAEKFLEKQIVELGDVIMVATPTLALGKTIYENDNAGIPYYLYNFAVVNLGTVLLQTLIPEEKPNKANKKSFPSGHASAAFSGATYVHFRYSLYEARWLYAMAAFVAFSRVYGNRHYFHDVLVSAGLSLLSSYFLVKNKNINKIYSVNYNPENKALSFNFLYRF